MYVVHTRMSLGDIIHSSVMKISELKFLSTSPVPAAPQLSSSSIVPVICKGLGILAVHFLDAVGPAITACSLGSTMVCDSLESILDPILVKLNLPNLKSNPQAVFVLKSVLAATGVGLNLKSKGPLGTMPSLIAPVVALEKILKEKLIS